MAEETATTEATSTTETTESTQETSTQEGKAETKETDESLLGAKTEEKTREVEIPESYEFQLPEGREIDKEMVEKFTPVLKELKIGQEGANKLANLLVADQVAKEQAYQKITEGWKEETIKQLGTDHQSQLALAAKFIDKFGNDQVRQVLNDTGLGNHPQVVAMFIKAGKHFGNDTFATGTNTKTISDPEKQARKLFNNTDYK